MELEIIYFFRNKDPNAKIIADFGIKVKEWDLTLVKMKLIKSAAGHLFVAPPSYKVSKYGEDEYKNYWSFGREKGKKFFDQVLQVVDAYMNKKKPIEDESESLIKIQCGTKDSERKPNEDIDDLPF